MCGIFALHSTTRQVTEEPLRSACEALRHRGPDGAKWWISSNADVGLAHTRLSIIDVAGGTQPLQNEDGSIHAIVNGEFYGYETIRSALQAKGHHFRTGSDSEILLHLYEEHGVGALEYLRGEFAFVLWDEKKKLLFAARDRFGIKPLVYHFDRGTLHVASEAKALFASGVAAAWDEGAFFHAASTQYVPLDGSLFRGVSQVRPGHFLTLNEGQLRISCYWDLNLPGESFAQENRSESETIDQFKAEFKEAVKLRLRSDVPYAFHLSGGLDSSSVVAAARECVGDKLHCFTVSFEHEHYDEEQLARNMAEHVGASLTVIKVRQNDIVENLSKAVYFSEGLAVNGHFSAKYLLNHSIASNGFKVALTGEGSDEVLLGYPHFRADIISAEDSAAREANLARLYAENKASSGIMLSHGEKQLPMDAAKKQLGYLPSFLEAKGALGKRIHGMLSAEFLAAHAGTDSYEKLIKSVDRDGQLRGRSRVAQSQYLWSKTALTNYILRTLGDGMEMAQSVEGRLPFLDHKLFEFLAGVPLNLKIRDGIEKYILREALRPRITKGIYERRKHPFVAPPLSAAAKDPLLDYYNELFRSSDFVKIRFYDQKKVIALLDRLPGMHASERGLYDPPLMMAASATALATHFKL